jgi:RNA polymerase sporulation-specific sigma factor
MHKTANTWSKIYDIDDLEQMCLLGLYKAYNKYDSTKGYQFMTYAGIIMTNEIKMYHRKEAKYINMNYIEDGVNGTEKITYEDFLEDEINYEDKALESIQLKEIYSALDILTERDKQIVLDYYIYSLSQVHLQQKYKLTQPVISRTLKKSLSKIRNKISYL